MLVIQCIMSTPNPNLPECMTRFILVDGAQRVAGSRYDFKVVLNPPLSFDPSGTHWIQVVTAFMDYTERVGNNDPRQPTGSETMAYIRLVFGPATGSSIAYKANDPMNINRFDNVGLDNIIGSMYLRYMDNTEENAWVTDKSTCFNTAALFAGTIDSLNIQLITDKGVIYREEADLARNPFGPQYDPLYLEHNLRMMLQITSYYPPPAEVTSRRPPKEPIVPSAPLFEKADGKRVPEKRLWNTHKYPKHS